MLLRGSVLLESSFLSRSNENNQLLQYGHTYQLSIRVNVKTIDVHTCVLWNSVKTETFTHWNDRRTKRNVNFLLATTVGR